jgi:hypothetical protein
LGVGDIFPTSTSAAKRFAQLTNNAADDNTILRMSAYATPCPRFGKINLAQHRNRPDHKAAVRRPAAGSFAFLRTLLHFTDRNV